MISNNAKSEIETEINRRPNDKFLVIATARFMVTNYSWVQELPARVTVQVDDDFFLDLNPDLPLQVVEAAMISNETMFNSFFKKVMFKAIIEGGLK